MKKSGIFYTVLDSMEVILMRRKFFKINNFFISTFISLLTIFLKGIILMNSQTLGNMKTYSGGYPIAWFEFYYPADVNLSIGYVYSNFSNQYKVELFAFFLNVLIITIIVELLKGLYKALFKNNIEN